MEHDGTMDRNYWHLLEGAEGALAAGDFPAAERAFLAAEDRRQASPGRVFLTESVTDGLRRLFRRAPDGDEAAAAGRWQRRAGGFRREFLAAGERAVRGGVRLAELRPEDDAEANQPVLCSALFLVVRSRIFPEELASAVPLLKGLFRTAARTGRLFDVELIRHDVPLTEEDRLWLARRGGDLLEIFLEQGQLQRGTGPAREWAAAVLQLLQPRYFGTSSRLAEERAWLEAVTADRLQGDAAASVGLYRAFLQASPEPGPRADEARVRTLELLANVDAAHFPVPRYDEALGALQSAGLAQGSGLAARYGTAVARIEHRRPEPEPGAEPAAWATAALGGDGSVTVVYWWGSEPRDLALWAPCDDAAALDRFLDPCGGRVVARDVATLAAVGAAWDEGLAPWPIGMLVEALAEPELPRAGLDQAALRRFAAGEGAPWRAGWRRELGRPELKPADDWDSDPRLDSGLGRAVTTGLAVLALRRRVGGSEPALRAGLAELARCGDRAARTIYALLTAGDEAARAMDGGFAAWTLPLLWTRPDPFTGSAAAPAADAGAHSRPDLGRNDVAVVSTGDAGAVLAAWGAGRGRWRVVLDRMDRLAELVPAAASVVGPVTVIPRDGLVHRLDGALDRLTGLVRAKADADDPLAGLLAVFHWVRMVTTHNGDLLDFLAVRPWTGGAFPLYERYAEEIADLPRERPLLASSREADGWGAQFGQRARKAGFVAGHVDQLPAEAAELDGLWGVFEGSEASWVFLDAAAVHLRLATTGGDSLAGRHHVLLQRGRRHLSVLTGAVWCREDLEDLLAGWLAVYGPAYRLALTDLATPPLVLADRGAVPGGRQLGAEFLAAALAHVAESGAQGERRHVLAPTDPATAAFWRAAAEGRFAVPGDGWQLADGISGGARAGTAGVLVVPELVVLTAAPPPPADGDAEAWRAADRARAAWSMDVRRRCSLEIAAYLAGGWQAVEILDARWWRLLRDGGDSAGAPLSDGVQAVAAAAPGRARCIDLPEIAGDARRRLTPALAAEVTAWASSRGWPASVTPAAPWPAAGSRLEIGSAEARRESVLAALAAAWERGRLERWCLVVSTRPWPGAADLVASAGVSGASVWPAQGQAPAPVLWAQPGDLLGPELPAYVARCRPAAVIVPDFEDWLPGAARAAQREAAALRAVLALESPVLLLLAGTMAKPWQQCLGAMSGLEVVAAAAPASAPVRADLPLPGTLVARLRLLLAQLRPQLEQRAAAAPHGRPDLDGELVPTARLAVMAGLAGADVRDAVRVLRWVGRVAGDHLSAAESAAAGQGGSRTHAMLFTARFAEIEHDLDLLGEALGLLLPLWLGRLPVGGRTWLDLEQPPARIDAALLARADTWLLGSGVGACGLHYAAPRGVLTSARRFAGPERPLAAVQDALHGDLELFRRRVQDVLSAAVETGHGFLVDTGLEELRSDESAFLALGAALGFWRWFGPAGPDALPLVDLVTLADSPMVRERSEGWALAGALGGRPAAPGAAAVAGDAAPRRGGLRSLFGGGDDETGGEAEQRVAALADGASDARFLVLRGLAGTGRSDAVVAGLRQALRNSDDPGDVTVYCPDHAVAAAVARRATRAGLALDLRLPPAGDLPEAAAPAAQVGVRAGGDDVVVMLEIQRFAPEVRYRIADYGRRRRLLMTVDPAASPEAWENLFLTTPRTSDLHTLDEQRDQARRLWEQVRTLAPAALAAETRSGRRERGLLAAEYAANLDQCVARIVLARAQDELPRVLRLSAPLAADLDFLAGALREQGWLAVDEEELDALALPGPCDLLAAAADLLAAAGMLRGAAPVAAAADGAGAPGWEPLLPQLPRPSGLPAPAWPPAGAVDAQTVTLSEVAALLAASPPLAPALAHPAARRRCDALLVRWGGRALADLAREPLWQAWWSTLMGDLGRPDPAPDRPLVRLNPASRAPGVAVPGAVVLCLGGEEPRQHYGILARATDAVLILYQERSPLADS